MTECKPDTNIIEIDKNKKLTSTSMTVHETDMNTTKIEKYKKLNMTEHKTGMNITEIDKYKKAGLYNGTQNRIRLPFDKPKKIRLQIQQRSNKPPNSSRKRLTKIFNQQMTSIHFL